jgi:hypothetical protein
MAGDAVVLSKSETRARSIRVLMSFVAVVASLLGVIYWLGLRADERHVQRAFRYIDEIETGFNNNLSAVSNLADRSSDTFKSNTSEPSDETKQKISQLQKRIQFSDLTMTPVKYAEIKGECGIAQGHMLEGKTSSTKAHVKAQPSQENVVTFTAISRGASLVVLPCKAFGKAPSNAVFRKIDVKLNSLLPRYVSEPDISELLLMGSDGNLLARIQKRSVDDDRRQTDESPHSNIDRNASLVSIASWLQPGTEETLVGGGQTKARLANRISNGSTVLQEVIGGRLNRIYIHPFRSAGVTELDQASDQPKAGAGGETSTEKASRQLYAVALEPVAGTGLNRVHLDDRERLILLFVALTLLSLIPFAKLLLTDFSDSLTRMHVRLLAIAGVYGFALLAAFCNVQNMVNQSTVQLQSVVEKTAVSLREGLESDLENRSKEMLEQAANFGLANCTGDSAVNVVTGHDAAGPGKLNILSPDSEKLFNCNPDQFRTSCSADQRCKFPLVITAFSIGQKGVLTNESGGLLDDVRMLWHAGCRTMNASVHLDKREYFKLAFANGGARLFGDTGPKVVAQRLRNLSDARLSTQLASKCKSIPMKDKPVADVLLSSDAVFPSVESPVLPLNLQFLVFDLRTGGVLFHSNPDRILVEDFVQETDSSPELVAAINVRSPASFLTNYRGQKTWMRMEVMKNFRWGVVAMAAREPLDAIALRAALVSWSVLALGLLLLIVLVQILAWIGGERLSHFLWPQWRLRALYGPYGVGFISLALLLAYVAERSARPSLAILVGSVILVQLILLASRPLPFAAQRTMIIVLVRGVALVASILAWAFVVQWSTNWSVATAFIVIGMSAWLFWLSVAQRAFVSDQRNRWKHDQFANWLKQRLGAVKSKPIPDLGGFFFHNLDKYFTTKYLLWLASIIICIAVIPGWKIAKLSFHSELNDAMRLAEQSTRIRLNLRIRYFEEMKTQLISPPLIPEQFIYAQPDIIQAGIHPTTDKGMGFRPVGAHQQGNFENNGFLVDYQKSIPHLYWKWSEDRGAYVTESYLQQVGQWFSGLNSTTDMIGLRAATQSGVFDVKFDPPTSSSMHEAADELKVTATVNRFRRLMIFATLVVLGLFVYFLDRMLLGSRLIWSGRQGPIKPPEVQTQLTEKCLLVIRQTDADIVLFLESNKPVTRLDLADSRWLLNGAQPKKIWIDGLDVVIDNKEARTCALDRLENLLRDFPGATIWLNTDAPPLYKICHPGAFPPSGTVDDAANGSEKLRWAKLFTKFRKVYRLDAIPHATEIAGTGDVEGTPASSPSPNSDPYLEELIEAETRLFWPAMRLLRKELLIYANNQNSHAERLTERDVVERVEMDFGALMRKHWETTTIDERLVMHQLATDDYANPGNDIVLLHLMRRGLVVSEPYLKLKTKALRTFVLQAEPAATFARWQAATPMSPWQSFRYPLLGGVLVILLYLGSTSKELLQLVTGALGACTAALGLLSKTSTPARTDVSK